MKKKALCILAAAVFCFILPWPASANSAEPPCFTVLVPAPPGDLELTIEFDAAQDRDPQRLSPEWMLWEGYYRFYGRWDIDPEGLTGARLVAETGGESFALPIDPTGFARHNNLITLDVGPRTLTQGQPWWRQTLLVVLRVALTLALEGLIFYLWGYREKRSWIVFLMVNLVTQFGVNIAILCFLPAASRTYDAMWAKVLLYGPMEVLVILLEAIALPLLLKEQRKRTAVGCAVMANILSWFLGSVLLSVLPV